MTGRSHVHAVSAATLWATSFIGQPLLPISIHRMLLSGAITATVVYYIDRRATDRDVLMRLGLWTGAAVEKQRCTMVHDSEVKQSHPAQRDPRPRSGAVDSGACPATGQGG